MGIEIVGALNRWRHAASATGSPYCRAPIVLGGGTRPQSAERCHAPGVGGYFRRAVAPRVLGHPPADLGYEPIADSGAPVDRSLAPTPIMSEDR